MPKLFLEKLKSRELAISTAGGFCLAASVANHFLRFWYRSLAVQVLGLVFLTLILGLMIYGIIRAVIKPIFSKGSSRDMVLWVILPLIASAALYFIPPQIIPGLPEWTKTPLPPRWHNLEINTLDERNSQSQSSEIWLRELRGTDGMVIPFSKLTTTGDWQIQHVPYDSLVSVSGKGSSIRYQFYSHWDKEVVITFYAHPAAGKVMVRLDGTDPTVDLFDRVEGDRVVTLYTDGEVVWKFLLFGMDILSLWLLIFILRFAFPIAKTIYRPVERAASTLHKKSGITLTHIEWLSAAVFALGLWKFLADHAGGPSAGGVGGRDNLWYLYTAMFSVQEPSLLNRYFHIYLLKFFLSVFGNDPFLSVKVFWGFCIAFTALFVYINTRLLTTNKSRVAGITQGILALMLFLPQPEILSLQMSLTDYPLMLLAVIAVAIYLLVMRWPQRCRTLLVVFGLVMFFAFKTKENGLALLFLTFGFALDDHNQFNWHRLLNAIAWITAGILIGQLLFILLDAVILKDAFFEFRPATWQQFVSFNTEVKNFRTYDSWYWPYTYDVRRFTVFILALASLIYLERRGLVNQVRRMVWVLPLALISLLSIFMIKSEWGVITRYVLWSLPVFSILAVQFLQNGEDSSEPHPLKFFLVVLSAWLFAAIASDLFIHPFVEATFKWDRRMFLDAILAPLALTGLVSLLILSKKSTYSALFISTLCLAFILSPFQSVVSIWQEEPDKLVKMEWAETSQKAYYPYIKFASAIQPSASTRLYVSPSLEQEQMLSDDPQNNLWSLSIFFKTRVKSVDHFSSEPFTPGLLVSEPFDYVFLQTVDWDTLTPDQNANIQLLYEVNPDTDRGIIFLKKR